MTGRPWWKRKRWWAAGALGLVVIYPYSVGPVTYAARRDWLSPTAWLVVAVVYKPIDPIFRACPWLARWSGYEANVLWWQSLADKHSHAPAASD